MKELWRANEVLPNWEMQYGFTHFALTLNEPDESELESDANLNYRTHLYRGLLRMV